MARMRQLFSEINNDFSNFDVVYEKMEKWTKKINIFEKDFLFFPVHENEHWSLIVLCYPQRLLSDGKYPIIAQFNGLIDGQMPFVIFLDSLCRMDNIYAAILFQYDCLIIKNIYCQIGSFQEKSEQESLMNSLLFK